MDNVGSSFIFFYYYYNALAIACSQTFSASTVNISKRVLRPSLDLTNQPNKVFGLSHQPSRSVKVQGCPTKQPCHKRCKSLPSTFPLRAVNPPPPLSSGTCYSRGSAKLRVTPSLSQCSSVAPPRAHPHPLGSFYLPPPPRPCLVHLGPAPPHPTPPPPPPTQHRGTWRQADQYDSLNVSCCAVPGPELSAFHAPAHLMLTGGITP